MYRGSWCAEGLSTSWECRWRAVGTNGSAAWDGNESVQRQSVTGGNEFWRELTPVEDAPAGAMALTGHAGAIDEFMTNLKAGTTPQIVCTDNIKSLAMVHAAIESAGNTERIKLRPLGD